MLKLRVKSYSQQKFVQNYLNTMKEGEKMLGKDVKIGTAFE